MAGFLYFIPDRQQPIPHPSRIPSDCELHKHFADQDGMACGFTPTGPTGGPGMMFALKESRSLGYSKDHQSWTEVKGEHGTSHWVGWDKEDRPTPKDLARPKMTDGKLIIFGDGNEWLIPAVYANHTTLPKTYRYFNGKMNLVTVSGYDDIIADAQKWMDIMLEMIDGNNVSFKPWDFIQFAADLLSINYRVGIIECTCGTDIINDSSEMFSSILSAAFGIHHVTAEIESQKKTDIQPVG